MKQSTLKVLPVVLAILVLMGAVGRDWRASDHGYVNYDDNILVGRLPASTLQEIRDYLAKCDQYINAGGSPAWARRMLWANDNGNFGCNGTPGEWTVQWENAWSHDHVPPTIPVTVMHSTDWNVNEGNRL